MSWLVSHEELMKAMIEKVLGEIELWLTPLSGTLKSPDSPDSQHRYLIFRLAIGLSTLLVSTMIFARMYAPHFLRISSRVPCWK